MLVAVRSLNWFENVLDFNNHRYLNISSTCLQLQSFSAMCQSMAADEFVKQLHHEVPIFLEQIEAAMPFVKEYYADHVCWRTESKQEYDDLILSLRIYDGATLLIESIIGGRPISTFKLRDGIMCCSNRRNVMIIEIPSPKEGSPYPKGLEHVEFAIGDLDTMTPINNDIHQSKLEKLMNGHDDIRWNIKAKDKRINPDVSMKLDLSPEFGQCSVKFHLMPLEKVIEFEIAHKMT
jgi:predicted metalloenzyme YecM